MRKLQPYRLVRVVQLLQSPDVYDGWRINRHPPKVGDTGIIVDILQSPGLPDQYVVESSDNNGITIWLGDFRAEELMTIDTSESTLQVGE